MLLSYVHFLVTKYIVSNINRQVFVWYCFQSPREKFQGYIVTLYLIIKGISNHFP